MRLDRTGCEHVRENAPRYDSPYDEQHVVQCATNKPKRKRKTGRTRTSSSSSLTSSVVPEGVEHPYLRNMEFRGGGYAILRALWDAEQSPAYRGYMAIKKIQRRGQQYCNVSMANNHWAGNDHGYGWESNKSLMSYKLITRVSHRSFATGLSGAC